LFVLTSFSVFSQDKISNQNGDLDVSEVVDMKNISEDASSDYFSNIDEYHFNENNIDSPSTIGLFVRMIIVLIIVVVLIYFVFFFIKKKSNYVKDDDDFLRRVASLSLAPGKSVEVVTLVDKAFLIGVTDDKISLIGEITDAELIQAMNLNADKKKSQKKPVNFDDVLGMFMGNKAKNVDVYKDSESRINNLFNKK
jgi:flagellar protein FliO/FliZ